jgi:hypothetical protein
MHGPGGVCIVCETRDLNVHLSFESVKAHRLIIFLELPK